VLAAWTARLVEEHAPPQERARLLAELDAGHDGGRDDGGDPRMPYRAVAALWERIPAHRGDSAFGIRFAQRVEVASLGVVGYFASTAETLGGALERVHRFHRVLKDPSELSLTIAPDVVRIAEAPPLGEGPYPRHLAEAILAVYVVLARRWTGEAVGALSVRFQHAAPEDTRAHREAFGCAPVFGAEVNELTFPGASARLRLVTADTALGRYLEPVAAARLEALPARDALLADLARAVLGALPDGYPSIRHAARKLGLSARSLQRRLEERSTRYQDVVDAVRHEAATRLLADPSISVAEVAFLLGFSDTSGFHRAFRRWTGHAPRRGPSPALT
jgi:AraC-like DNA-binding protein